MNTWTTSGRKSSQKLRMHLIVSFVIKLQINLLVLSRKNWIPYQLLSSVFKYEACHIIIDCEAKLRNQLIKINEQSSALWCCADKRITVETYTVEKAVYFVINFVV